MNWLWEQLRLDLRSHMTVLAIIYMLANHIRTQGWLHLEHLLFLVGSVKGLDQAGRGWISAKKHHVWTLIVGSQLRLWPTFVWFRRGCEVRCPAVNHWWLDTQMLSIELSSFKFAHLDTLRYIPLSWLHCLARLRYWSTMHHRFLHARVLLNLTSADKMLRPKRPACLIHLFWSWYIDTSSSVHKVPPREISRRAVLNIWQLTSLIG